MNQKVSKVLKKLLVEKTRRQLTAQTSVSKKRFKPTSRASKIITPFKVSDKNLSSTGSSNFAHLPDGGKVASAPQFNDRFEASELDTQGQLPAGLVQLASEDNTDEITFTVEITVRAGARLATLSIDEIDLSADEIKALEDDIKDDVMTAKLPVEVNTNNASVFIKFVGEPNVSVPVKIKFMDDVIFDDEVTIKGNREGVLNEILPL